MKKTINLIRYDTETAELVFEGNFTKGPHSWLFLCLASPQFRNHKFGHKEKLYRGRRNGKWFMVNERQDQDTKQLYDDPDSVKVLTPNEAMKYLEKHDQELLEKYFGTDIQDA